MDDCIHFIQAASTDGDSLHRAIVNENDEYLGTVSLKNITDESAEFAITIRKSAMGKGISKWAMNEIINYGFEKIKVKTIYWCVNPINERAVRFYDKNFYQRIIIEDSDLMKDIKKFGYYTENQIHSYVWYSKTLV